MDNMKLRPLAIRMRPDTVDDIVGQEHILGPGSLLRNMIETDNLHSIILYGPPGTGKTTIANVIAKTTKSNFEQVNAVSSGKKDIEMICTRARKALDDDGTRTILFIDEIHRFNKAQQDYLLPFVEDGTVILIGATTENPFFEVNRALLSRTTLLSLKEIEPKDIQALILRALNDVDNGLGDRSQSIDMNAVNMIVNYAGGDIRHSLTILELASVHASDNGVFRDITVEDISAVITRACAKYDSDGDEHYNVTSAFIKSMRGSDPDATLYYLAKMIDAGEDPKFIARRIVISASEDIGNADPMALCVATNAALAVERVGMPEGRIILSQAALYNALAPKSNSALVGIDNALQYVSQHAYDVVPPHLRDAHYKSATQLGSGVGYLYPHDYLYHYVPQRYLPDTVPGTFYQSSQIGAERNQWEYANFIRSIPR